MKILSYHSLIGPFNSKTSDWILSGSQDLGDKSFWRPKSKHSLFHIHKLLRESTWKLPTRNNGRARMWHKMEVMEVRTVPMNNSSWWDIVTGATIRRVRGFNNHLELPLVNLTLGKHGNRQSFLLTRLITTLFLLTPQSNWSTARNHCSAVISYHRMRAAIKVCMMILTHEIFPCLYCWYKP